MVSSSTTPKAAGESGIGFLPPRRQICIKCSALMILVSARQKSRTSLSILCVDLGFFTIANTCKIVVKVCKRWVNLNWVY